MINKLLIKVIEFIFVNPTSLFVNFPFPVNKVRDDIDHVQDAVNTFIPSNKKEVLVLNRSEIDCVIDSINSAGDQMLIV